MELQPKDLAAVENVLETSKEWGFLGPGPIRRHTTNALALADVLARRIGEDRDPRRVLDLGSGGGVPGLVLAVAFPEWSFVLLDASARRCSFLGSAIEELGLGRRVAVQQGRAEVLARQPELRHCFDAVVARSFGAPAVVAECGVGFLSDGGSILVSEPPGALGERWPQKPLAQIGLQPSETAVSDDTTIQVLKRVGPDDVRFPRRDGIPGKRPLF